MKKNKRYAITSLILGGMSIVGCFLWYLSIYLATAGMMYGFLSYRESKKSEQDLPLAGMIVCSVGLFASVLFVAFMIFVINQVAQGNTFPAFPAK